MRELKAGSSSNMGAGKERVTRPTATEEGGAWKEPTLQTTACSPSPQDP